MVRESRWKCEYSQSVNLLDLGRHFGREVQADITLQMQVHAEEEYGKLSLGGNRAADTA